MALGAHLNENRSLGRLFKDLSIETVALLRHEVDLAKTEVSEKIAEVATMSRAVGIGAALAAGGGLALLTAVIVGLASLLSKFMSPWIAVWLAPLVVGIILAAVGYAMIRAALAAPRQSLMPRKTAQSLQENKEWLKSKIA